MKNLYKLIIAICVFSIVGIQINAQNLHLPSFFSDNMVLQQNSSVAVWGRDKPNQKISIKASWGKKAQTRSDKNGNWKAYITTTPTHCLKHTLTIKGSSKITFHNVLLGEVWFCSGQSNMVLTMNGSDVLGQFIEGANDAFIHASDYPMLRIYKSPQICSDTLCSDIPNTSWQLSTAENIKDFSALAYFYGRKLQSTLKVPVGMIVSAWGGAGVEAFINDETMSHFKNYSIYDDNPVNKADNHVPSGIYRGMIHPFVGYSIKGFLWYQGENNRPHPKEYKELFPAMVKQWRSEWAGSNGEKLPFYYVQIAPLSEKFQKGNSAYLREAQMESLNIIPNSGMVTTNDIGFKNCIHPFKKKEVADRLALLAFKNVYGYEYLIAQAPIYREFKVLNDDKALTNKYGEGGKVQVYFDFAEKGLTSYNEEIRNFEMAGPDRKFYPAKAVAVRRTSSVIVTCDKVSEPVAVRYCFKCWCVGNLYNTAGLPASSFRTDRWKDDNDSWSYN